MPITTVRFAITASANFELRIDIMARAGANGGVYVLTKFEEVGGNERASGRFPSKGFEVQLYNGTGGPRTGSLYHVVDLDESLVKDEEWFTQTIIVNGDTIVVQSLHVLCSWAVSALRPRSASAGASATASRFASPVFACARPTT
jgi:3-keto-disaccharide hydrolase